MNNENKYILNERRRVRLDGVRVNTTKHHYGSSRLYGMPIPDDQVGQPQYSKIVVSEKKAAKYKNIGSGFKYLTVSNPKTAKGLAYGYITAILHLAPAKYSGNVTCHRFSQCATTCLYHQGRGRFSTVQNARIRRTNEFFNNREGFFMSLHHELSQLQYKLRGANNPNLCVRLNGTSDICWEDIKVKAFDNKTIFDAFPNVQFYDYTKYKWGTRTAWNEMPINYHLTYSFDGTEADVANAKEVLSNGWNVSVIYNKNNYKTNMAHIGQDTLHQWGFPTFDNELNDLRFLDARPQVLIGKEKGYSNIAI
jgi:hypothetical protein